MMVTLTALLAKGYFPRELPPPFNTVSFARHAKKAGAGWPKDEWTRCAAHNLARPGGLRRPLKIPHPISYFALADLIAANWTEIAAHTGAHRLSATRPYVMKSSDRATRRALRAVRLLGHYGVRLLGTFRFLLVRRSSLMPWRMTS